MTSGGSSQSISSSSSAGPTIPTAKYMNVVRLTICASGICFCYWFYGFLQEKLLTKSNLGATFMLVLQTVANTFVALLWQRVEVTFAAPATTPRNDNSDSNNNNKKKTLNHPLLFVISACYVFAMAASNESLRFVSYPVAVLAKSCKLIPTMAMGSLIERRQYSWEQWLAAILISAGIGLFNLSRIKVPTSTADSHLPDLYYWRGMMLLFVSLCMDGFLGAFQGMLKRQDPRKQERPPTAVETMLFVNLYSLLFLVPMAVTSGQWDEGLHLLKSDEALRSAVGVLNAVVSIGQIFIFLTITWYSSLITTTITTTRKFFTILFSVLHFGHAFSIGQWTSVLMVFSGLYISIATGSKHVHSKQGIPEGKKMD